MLGAAGLLIVAYAAIAVDPYLPINPYPPLVAKPTSTPSPTPAEPPRSPAPAAQERFASPTPLRPATPRPSPTPQTPFAATVEWKAAPKCDHATLAGVVLDAEGNPLEGYPVHVWGPGLDLIAMSGSAPELGPSGWSVVLNGGQQPTEGTYYIQLHELDVYRGHPAVSPIIAVEFTGTCSKNVAIVYFEELGVRSEQVKGENR